MVREFKLNKTQREQQQKLLEREFLACVRKLTEEEQKHILDMMILFAKQQEHERYRKASEEQRECVARRREFAIIG